MRRATWILPAIGVMAITMWLMLREDGGGSKPGAESGHVAGPSAVPTPPALTEGPEGRAAASPELASPAPAPIDYVSASCAMVCGRMVYGDGTPRPGIRLALVESGMGELDD